MIKVLLNCKIMDCINLLTWNLNLQSIEMVCDLSYSYHKVTYIGVLGVGAGGALAPPGKHI